MDGLDDVKSSDTVLDANQGVSFDDLDAVDATRSEILEHKVTERKEVEKKVEAKEKGPAKDADGSEPKEKKADQPKEKKTEAKEKAADAKAAAAIKKLQAKYGEEIFELPADALIPHKIDGQDVEVPLREVLNNYSGKTAWDKKFSELDRERKSFIAERDGHVQKLEEFKRLVMDDKSDPMDAVRFLLDQANVRKDTYFKRLRESLMPDIQAYLEMDEHERKAHDTELENKFLRDELESVSQSKARQQTEKDLHSQLTAIRETHNLQDEDMVEAYNFALKHGGAESVKTLDGITSVALELRASKKTAQLLDGFNRDLIADKEVFDEVFDIIIAHPEFEDNELKEIIAAAYGSPKDVETVKKKIADDNRKAPKGVDTKEREDYVSFDDFKH